MRNYETIKVPVTQAVKNYLLLSPFYEKPLKVTEKHPVGCYLIGLMMAKRNMPLHLPRYSDKNVIEIFLGEDKRYNKLYWIPPHRARIFNKWVKDRMWEDLYTRIMEARKLEKKFGFKLNLDELLREFEKEFSLNNTEMSFPTLQRDVYRNHNGFKTVTTTTVEDVALKLSVNDVTQHTR